LSFSISPPESKIVANAKKINDLKKVFALDPPHLLDYILEQATGGKMADKVKLSKDGNSIDFVQSESIPTSVKKFRQSPEIEGFYRFIFENDLQKEAYEILERIVNARKAKKKIEKQEAAAAAAASAPKKAEAKVTAKKTEKKAEKKSEKVEKAPAKKAAAAKKAAPVKKSKPAPAKKAKASAPAKKKAKKK
jgi:hypothetical protein